jgi:hypothetical protein
LELRTDFGIRLHPDYADALSSLSDFNSSDVSPNPSDISAPRAKRKRQRSAFVSELEFVEFAFEGDPVYSCIRKWKNDRNLIFYDCACGSRKAGESLCRDLL